MDENSGMYRDFAIEYNIYGENEYTVQWDGDDVWFNSYEEATAFVDSLLDTDDAPTVI